MGYAILNTALNFTEKPGFFRRHPGAPWGPNALQAVLRLKLLHLLQVLIDETSDHGQSDCLPKVISHLSLVGWGFSIQSKKMDFKLP